MAGLGTISHVGGKALSRSQARSLAKGESAAATGIVAWTSKKDLDQQLGMFPADNNEIDYDRRRTRGFALATDGLLIGTAIMASISLYLTFRDPK